MTGMSRFRGWKMLLSRIPRDPAAAKSTLLSLQRSDRFPLSSFYPLFLYHPSVPARLCCSCAMADTTTLVVAGVLIGFAAIIAAVMLYRCVFAAKTSSEDAAGADKTYQPLLPSGANGDGGRGYGSSATGTQSSGTPSPSSPADRSTAAKAVPGKYQISRQLGKGTYGDVYLATRAADNHRVAVKVISCPDTRATREAYNEFQLCQSLQGHPNVIQVLDLFEDYPGTGNASPSLRTSNASRVRNGGGTIGVLGVPLAAGCDKAICIVTEFFEEGTLFDLLQKRAAGLPEATIWFFCEQMLSALCHIHSSNVIHRDMKPSNILLSKGCRRLVLTDFGLSRESTPDQYVNTKTGTFHFMAPEQMMRRYNAKVDVWGVGCMIHAMCTARVAAKDAPVMFQLRRQPQFEHNFTTELAGKGYSDSLIRYALRLLCESASARPTSAEALEELQRIRGEAALASSSSGSSSSSAGGDAAGGSERPAPSPTKSGPAA